MNQYCESPQFFSVKPALTGKFKFEHGFKLLLPFLKFSLSENTEIGKNLTESGLPFLFEKIMILCWHNCFYGMHALGYFYVTATCIG